LGVRIRVEGLGGEVSEGCSARGHERPYSLRVAPYFYCAHQTRPYSLRVALYSLRVAL